MTPEEEAEYNARRKGRNAVFGLILLAFVVLVYAITVVRVTD